ncbi:hypothetical protein SVAN01_08319 [Stagonosporopsis vannaccii]|nr:hypothetical protein SVAN01_08319 [Stagonosporopsis vannaccii]
MPEAPPASLPSEWAAAADGSSAPKQGQRGRSPTSTLPTPRKPDFKIAISKSFTVEKSVKLSSWGTVREERIEQPVGKLACDETRQSARLLSLRAATVGDDATTENFDTAQTVVRGTGALQTPPVRAAKLHTGPAEACMASVSVDERKACSDLIAVSTATGLREDGGSHIPCKSTRCGWNSLCRRRISDVVFDELKRCRRRVPGEKRARNICDTATGQFLAFFQKEVSKRERSASDSSTHRAGQRSHSGGRRSSSQWNCTLSRHGSPDTGGACAWMADSAVRCEVRCLHCAWTGRRKDTRGRRGRSQQQQTARASPTWKSTRQNEVVFGEQLHCVPVKLSATLMFHCGYTSAAAVRGAVGPSGEEARAWQPSGALLARSQHRRHGEQDGADDSERVVPTCLSAGEGRAWQMQSQEHRSSTAAAIAAGATQTLLPRSHTTHSATLRVLIRVETLSSQHLVWPRPTHPSDGRWFDPCLGCRPPDSGRDISKARRALRRNFVSFTITPFELSVHSFPVSQTSALPGSVHWNTTLFNPSPYASVPLAPGSSPTTTLVQSNIFDSDIAPTHLSSAYASFSVYLQTTPAANTMIARENESNNMGRGAYDTTGTPKPPPPPK